MTATRYLSKFELDSYAPADSHCWILLANAIMKDYSESYMFQIPLNAQSQQEYDKLDAQKHAPMRRLILSKLKYGPLKNAVKLESVYYGLEQRRLENKQKLQIKWEDHYCEDLEQL